MKIDLLDPAAYDRGQPYAQLRWLQEHDPVHWHPEPQGPGFWAVTRYGLVKHDEHHHLIFSDPPHHTIHRKFLAPELSPVPVRNMREHLDVVANDIVDEVIERGECDLVPDLAGKLASYVTADLLGLPIAPTVIGPKSMPVRFTPGPQRRRDAA
jgi:cytochrome P450